MHTNTNKLIFMVLRIFAFLPAVFILLLIFGFSAQPGTASSSLSYKISLKIIHTFHSVFHISTTQAEIASYINILHILIRKIAHITEYFMLTLSLYLPFCTFDFFRNLPIKKRMLLTFPSIVFLAALDEFHQTMVPGRSGNFADVIVDSIGILAACSFLYAVSVWSKKREEP